MEKLDKKDFRFIVVCIITIVVGGLVTALLFRRAFPEASIEFRVNRGQARALAEKFLTERGRSAAEHRFAGRFSVDDEPKVYLERELGLEKAGAFYGREAKVWLWQMRWFRSGVKEEERAAITPLGDLASFDSVRQDDAPGASLTLEEARALSQKFLASRGLGPDLKSIEATPTERPHRRDWLFVDEKPYFKMAEATVRYRTIVTGSELTGFREFVHVPESWTRDYAKLRSKNETANVIGNFALIVTFLAMLVVLITRIVRKDVRWRVVGGFGLVAFLLSLLAIFNNLPLTLYGYDTASPLSSHIATRIVFGILGAIGIGAGIAVVVAAAEPVYRERFPRQLSFSGLFSRRGLRSKRLFLGLLLGYALTAFFFAYQAVFYVVAAKLGAWAPAEIPYDDILNTAIPWVTVLFVGFLPAVLEEGTSRMFSISFLDRLGAGRFVAVVLPAFIWGFNHAAYPNQPFYIRGIEVGIAGCVIGALMLRFGAWPLLVWHFTVDALYTAFLLLRSHNLYFVVSGSLSSLILILPLAVSLGLYLRRGGFQSEAGLTNGDEGSVPAPPPAPAVPEELAPPVRAIRPRVFLWTGVIAAVAASSFLVPSRFAKPLVEDATGRRNSTEMAREFLRANGIVPEPYHQVTYTGSGFTDDEQARQAQPAEAGGIPGFAEEDALYVFKQGGPQAIERLANDRLPLAFWVTRFFRPLEKAEWKVIIDSRRSRVIGFVHPIEEAAPADPAPSEARARERALSAAEKLGYPAASYRVLEVGRKNRPNRVDTTVVLESDPGGVGDARARLTAVFHGANLAAFYPSIRIPEAFAREYRRQNLLEPILIGLRVIAMGAFIGIGIVLFIRLVKTGGFGWKKWRVGLAAVGLVALAAIANNAPSAMRLYMTERPLSSFVTFVAVGWGLFGIVVLCGVMIAFVLLDGARPGWRRALRTQGTIGDAVLRAAIGAVGIIGLERWSRPLSERVPDLFEIQPTLPPGLEAAVPAVAVLWATLRFALVAGALAAVVVISSREPFFRKPAGRILVLVGIALVLMPTAFHTPLGFLGTLVPDLVTAVWLGVTAFVLLRDHVAAWVLFAVFVSGGPSVARLLEQPAPADQAAGWMSLALLVIGAAGVLAGGRRDPAVASPPPAPTALPESLM